MTTTIQVREDSSAKYSIRKRSTSRRIVLPYSKRWQTSLLQTKRRFTRSTATVARTTMTLASLMSARLLLTRTTCSWQLTPKRVFLTPWALDSACQQCVGRLILTLSSHTLCLWWTTIFRISLRMSKDWTWQAYSSKWMTFTWLTAELITLMLQGLKQTTLLLFL